MGISSVSLKVEPSWLLITCGERMCEHFCDTPQAHPCGLYASIHAGKGRSRVHTWYLTFSDLAAFGVSGE
ncbi:hypothetical protein TUM3794_18770 [Shewanella colwelliana]|uniref:Uncharacterized protein n=1 Tax=Shewanella colwelliana TaxID=23 RepID=A0ABQ4NZN5_SHECO|nr:hypothetical protein [Shewanella colwelliana]GIU40579.1 hypothetical protein TUM3794_18770 [Shewanella colwelliana]